MVSAVVATPVVIEPCQRTLDELSFVDVLSNTFWSGVGVAAPDVPLLGPTEDVKVEVEDDLATEGSDVGHHPISVGDALRLGHLTDQREDPRQLVAVTLVQVMG